MAGYTPVTVCEGRYTNKPTIERNQFGGKIIYQVIQHNDKLGKEFVLISPSFYFGRWLIWTTIFNTLGILLNLHTQESWVMSAMIGVLVLVLLLKLHLRVKQESLLVISSLGVQLTTTFATGRRKATFYDLAYVEDIVINEAVTMHRVLHYLTLLIRTNASSNCFSQLIPLFQHSWPSLKCLVHVYQGAQGVLHTNITRWQQLDKMQMFTSDDGVS